MALRIFYSVAGLANIANGIWMILSAGSWFNNLPAQVTDTGAFNGHLIRDLGLVYIIAGLAFAWGAKNPRRFRAMHIGLTVFFFGHAVMHVIDILLERLPASHWLVDIPLVFVPGIVMLVIALPVVWKRVNPEPELNH